MTTRRKLLLALSMTAAGILAQPDEAFAQETGRAQVEEEPAAESGRRPVQVLVHNNNWLDVNVFVVRGGSRYRLGTVTSMQREEFEVPSFVLANGGELQLLLRPIGSGRALLTQRVVVFPGDVVEWTVLEHLVLSHVSVWATDG